MPQPLAVRQFAASLVVNVVRVQSPVKLLR